jgi:hypothetical protein
LAPKGDGRARPGPRTRQPRAAARADQVHELVTARRPCPVFFAQAIDVPNRLRTIESIAARDTDPADPGI